MTDKEFLDAIQDPQKRKAVVEILTNAGFLPAPNKEAFDNDNKRI